MLKLTLFFVTLSLISFAQAETKVACTHPGVCRTLSRVLDSSVKVELLIGGGAEDPHHFEPTPKQVKELNGHPFLVSAPYDLQPWPKAIIKSRDNLKKTTVKIFLPSNIIKVYKQGAALPIESLSHYWLYPEVNCDIEKRLNDELKKLNLKTLDVSCDAEMKLKRIAALKQKFSDAVFILSHDAIAPLLKRFEFKTISLKGSGHHDEIDNKAIKELELVLSQKIRRPIIWIEELNIQIPATIVKRYRRPENSVVAFNPEGFIGKSLDFDKNDALDDLITKLESLAN